MLVCSPVWKQMKHMKACVLAAAQWETGLVQASGRLRWRGAARLHIAGHADQLVKAEAARLCPGADSMHC